MNRRQNVTPFPKAPTPRLDPDMCRECGARLGWFQQIWRNLFGCSGDSCSDWPGPCKRYHYETQYGRRP